MRCPHCRGIGTVSTSLGATVCSACRGSGEYADNNSTLNRLFPTHCTSAFSSHLAEAMQAMRLYRPQRPPKMYKYRCDYCEDEREEPSAELDRTRCHAVQGEYMIDGFGIPLVCPGTLHAVIDEALAREIRAQERLDESRGK